MRRKGRVCYQRDDFAGRPGVDDRAKNKQPASIEAQGRWPAIGLPTSCTGCSTAWRRSNGQRQKWRSTSTALRLPKGGGGRRGPAAASDEGAGGLAFAAPRRRVREPAPKAAINNSYY